MVGGFLAVVAAAASVVVELVDEVVALRAAVAAAFESEVLDRASTEVDSSRASVEEGLTGIAAVSLVAVALIVVELMEVLVALRAGAAAFKSEDLD